MNEQQIKAAVSGFVSRAVRAELSGSEDIFASGLVNSLFALQIVMFVEKEFGITVENEDLELDNFRSVEAITGFVARKRSAQAA